MDLLQELDVITAVPLVAPWEFTEDVYPLAELDRSLERWHKTPTTERPHGGYHGWHRGYTNCPGPSGHAYVEATARRPWPDTVCGSRMVLRAYCACGWVSGIIGSDHEAVAAWHDHAWPGWRDLPVLGNPPGDRGFNAKAMERWRATVAETQPADWQVEFAPVITTRDWPGTRDVPGYSPWGGFDIWEGTREAAA